MVTKSYILIFLITLFFQISCAQKKDETLSDKSTTNSGEQGDAEIRAKLKTQAVEINKAFLTGDYEKVFEMTHPKVQNFFGKDKFISGIKEGMKAAEEDGFKLVALDAAEPKEIVKVGSQMFAVVPQKMRMQTSQGLFVGDSSDIAISEDGGRTWTFIGGGADGANEEKLRALFPAAADKLQIPEIKQPVPYQEP